MTAESASATSRRESIPGIAPANGGPSRLRGNLALAPGVRADAEPSLEFARALRADPADATSVLAAYAAGWFMIDDVGSEEAGRPLRWSAPGRRAIIPLEALRIPRKVAKLLRSASFECRVDTAFEQVLDACAEPRKPPWNEVWITERTKRLYTELHARGFAHSFEVWRAGALAGGDLGIAIGRAFFAESGFHRGSSAGTICTAMALRTLRELGYELYDIQILSRDLERFGAVVIARAEYEQRLRRALAPAAAE